MGWSIKVPIVLAFLCLAACGTSSARLGPDMDSLGGRGGSFMMGGSALKAAGQNLMGMLGRRGKKDEPITAYATIRFVVPPSVAKDFEDAWLKLEKDVMDKDKGVEIFDLKRDASSNLLYWSYGEWKRMGDFHDHLTSDHFQDFAEFVDEQGIKWEVQLLKNLSEDIEDDQRKGEDEQEEQEDDDSLVRSQLERRHKDTDQHGGQGDQGGDWDKNIPEEYRHFVPKQYRPHHDKKQHRHKRELSLAATASLGSDAEDDSKVAELYANLFRHRHMFHAATLFIVPPGKGKSFTDAWTDTAKDTIKEKGNRIYSLRKVASDNTRFLSYGTWDSMTDYVDHLKSKHVGRLGDHVTKEDIVFFIIPSEKIGNEPERR